MAMRTKGWLLATAGAAVFGLTTLTADPAQAAFVEDSSAGTSGNNPCSGGDGLNPNCTVGPSELLSFETPQVAKYEFSDSGEFELEDVGTTYDGIIDGDEFSFSAFDPQDPKSGTWTYTPDIGEDPFVAAYGIKIGGSGGGTTKIFAWTGEGLGGFTDGWDEEFALSSITFYNTGVVPLPAAAWMMIGGLGMIGGAVARNRRKARADA